MKYCTISKPLFLTLFLSLFILINSGSAKSFPFRTIAPGEIVPDISLLETQSNKTTSFHKLRGKPAILFFWGGDIAEKKERSIKALKGLKGLASFLQENDVQLQIINVQNDEEGIISEIRQAAGVTGKMYRDSKQKAYEQLGIFIMPSLLLIDKTGKVVNGMGYSKNMIQRLRGEIEIMSGEKTAEQLEAELHPKVIEKSADEKKARRHLQMGLVLARKGLIETALEEFQKALSTKNDLPEAHTEMGCGYLQLGKTQEAQDALDTALDLDPDSLRAEICMAQLSARLGEVDEAIDDLKAMLFRHSRNAPLHYALGQFYQQQEKYAKAAEEFRKAYELLNKKMNFQE